MKKFGSLDIWRPQTGTNFFIQESLDKSRESGKLLASSIRMNKDNMTTTSSNQSLDYPAFDHMLTAFRGINEIENGTSMINIMNGMYNLSHASDLKYVFKLSETGAIVSIKRSDFLLQTYPNLTRSYIQLRLKQANKTMQTGDEKSVPAFTNSNAVYKSISEDDMVYSNSMTEKNFVEFVQSVNADLTTQNEMVNKSKYAGKFNEWKSFGLEGWKGELLKPQQINKSELRQPYETINIDKIPNENTYGSKSEWDLPGRVARPLVDFFDEKHTLSKIIKDITDIIKTQSHTKWEVVNNRENHHNEDIFIARSNNPFGHSTKMKLKYAASNLDVPDERQKRAVGELYSMIKCATGCDPLVFKGYGCYCGFRGAGVPINAIDTCCKSHDICYEQSSCVSYIEYFVPYVWKCYRGKPLCAIDHGEWGGQGSCASRLCKCDLQLARCLRKFSCPRRRAVCLKSPVRLIQNFLFV